MALAAIYSWPAHQVAWTLRLVAAFMSGRGVAQVNGAPLEPEKDYRRPARFANKEALLYFSLSLLGTKCATLGVASNSGSAQTKFVGPKMSVKCRRSS